MGVAEPAARGFGSAADLYEARRPSYPDDAVAWLVTGLQLGRSSRVVDLGAGTGKLTRQLVTTTPQVVAVEPLAAMCEQFGQVLDVPVLRGIAEALPIRAGCVDAVLVAQAFHWFDPDRALTEIHRVLRPGGGLGLIWNMRDERQDWVASFGEIRRRYGDIRYDSGRWRDALAASPLLQPLVEQRFSHQQALDSEGVVESMASRSVIAALDADENRTVREEVRQLLASHPETMNRDVLVVPYRTHVYWTTKVTVGL